MNARIAGPAPEADDPALAQARQITVTVYVLHAVMSVTVLTFFVAIFINYARRHQVAGTIYASHFDWQIRTFWFTLAYFLVGAVVLCWGIVQAVGPGHRGFALIAVGLLLLFVNWCWHLYRVIRGLLNWSERRPMSPP